MSARGTESPASRRDRTCWPQLTAYKKLDFFSSGSSVTTKGIVFVSFPFHCQLGEHTKASGDKEEEKILPFVKVIHFARNLGSGNS